MLQDRLNGFATCCIEKDILESIDLETIVNDFASRNARRSFFEKHWSTHGNLVFIWGNETSAKYILYFAAIL
jgi:hypothetical protein